MLGGVLTLGLQDGDADPLLLRLALHLAHRLRPQLAVPPCEGEALLERPHGALQLFLGLAGGDLLSAAVLHLRKKHLRMVRGKKAKKKVEKLVQKKGKKSPTFSKKNERKGKIVRRLVQKKVKQRHLGLKCLLVHAGHRDLEANPPFLGNTLELNTGLANLVKNIQ